MNTGLQEFFNLVLKLESRASKCIRIDTSDIINCAELFKSIYRTAGTINSAQQEWNEALSSLANCLSIWARSSSAFTEEQYYRLMTLKTVFPAIYQAGFDSRQRILIRTFPQDHVSVVNYKKLIILMSINNLNDELFKIYETSTLEEKLYLSIGWLSERAQQSAQARIFHQKLVNDFHLFKNISVDPSFFKWLSKAYMYTTYSSSDDKDTIKGVIHNIIRNSVGLKRSLSSIEVSKIITRKNPKIVIIHEYFSVSHVMHRCYGGIYKILDDHFDVTHLVNAQMDYQSLSSVYRNILPVSRNFADYVKALHDLGPDVIYYPSIGMVTDIIMLASFRLAPVQLQTFGHPSSSHSPCIDGSLHSSDQFHNTGPEKLTTYEGYKAGIHIPFTLADIKKPMGQMRLSMVTGTINIGINAKIMKLSPVFMEFLSKVDWGGNVRLNFFPAEQGTEFLVASNLIRSWFPQSEIYPIKNYEDFMKELSLQDLALCPFPFGNTNGILDCFYLSLPTFVLRGRDICSSPEVQLLEAVDLGDYIFKSGEDLRSEIEKFICDDERRHKIRKDFEIKTQNFIKDNNPSKAFEYEGRNFVRWIQQHINGAEQYA